MSSRALPSKGAVWAARMATSAVFLANLSAAIPYVFAPGIYTRSFEVQGAAGEAIVRGVGVLFLMWNVTFLPVIVRPDRQRALFAVVLLQQVIGLAGESWILLRLPPGHTALVGTLSRFILFDGLGLAVMALAYIWLHGPRNKVLSAAPPES